MVGWVGKQNISASKHQRQATGSAQVDDCKNRDDAPTTDHEEREPGMTRPLP